MDMTQDNIHSVLLHISGKTDIPGYVLDSRPMGKEAAEKLPDALFADRGRRRYPLDSKASTWLSAAYFAKTAADDGYGTSVMRDYVRDSILLAADKYGIRKDVEKAMADLSAGESVKTAADDESNYGWPSGRKYPMFDERGVRTARSYFEENAYAYPPEMRRTIASNILRKCAEYGIDSGDMVRREAGQGFSYREDVAAELVDRVKAASRENPEVAAGLARAVTGLLTRKQADYAPDVDRFAGTLAKADEALGFDRAYGSRFRSPMEIFHGRSMKEAEDILSDSIELGPHVFSIRKLASLPVSVFTDALGDGFAEALGIPLRKSAATVVAVPKEPSEEDCENCPLRDVCPSSKCRDGDSGFEAGEWDDHECRRSRLETDGGDEDGDGEDEPHVEVISPEKLGPALRSLDGGGRKAVYRSITVYMG